MANYLAPDQKFLVRIQDVPYDTVGKSGKSLGCNPREWGFKSLPYLMPVGERFGTFAGLLDRIEWFMVSPDLNWV